MIEGLVIEQLKQISDERGKVLHMIRSDSKLYKSFGEIYFSLVNAGSVKAWKKHKMMTQLFAVPIGAIKLVFFDSREESKTKGEMQELDIGEDNYCLVKIPPMIWYGFKGISQGPALIANCTDMPHDPDETIKVESSDKSIPYSW